MSNKLHSQSKQISFTFLLKNSIFLLCLPNYPSPSRLYNGLTRFARTFYAETLHNLYQKLLRNVLKQLTELFRTSAMYQNILKQMFHYNPHVTATLMLRFFNCVPLINKYVKYRDLIRAIKAHPSPRLSEASDSGALGGGCFVVPVDSLPLELRVVDLIVVRYILVLFDPVVSLTVSVDLFEVGTSVSVVVLVLARCFVFSVDVINVSVFVRLL